jgi:transposase-like protein
MGQQRLQFRPEFKADAVVPLWSPGRPVAAIADELGIGEPELSYWLKRTGRAGRRADPGWHRQTRDVGL